VNTDIEKNKRPKFGGGQSYVGSDGEAGVVAQDT
jgi:hypothetical protein